VTNDPSTRHFLRDKDYGKLTWMEVFIFSWIKY